MRNNVRKKMRLICLLFAMVLLAGVPAAAKDRKNQKAAAENVVKKEMVCKTNGTIYQWKNDSWRIKKKTIRTKKEFKKFQTVLKKKQEKGLRKMLKKQYAGTNFRKKSIVLVPQLLSPYMNYKYKAMVTKFDAKGKLVGEIQIERSGNMDKPGVSYPAIVKTYVVVVRVPKAQEAMIDYYQTCYYSPLAEVGVFSTEINSLLKNNKKLNKIYRMKTKSIECVMERIRKN